jgi:hypothetical protein
MSQQLSTARHKQLTQGGRGCCAEVEAAAFAGPALDEDDILLRAMNTPALMPCACKHGDTHTCMHACIHLHTHTHTCMHACLQTQKHTEAHIQTKRDSPRRSG